MNEKTHQYGESDFGHITNNQTNNLGRLGPLANRSEQRRTSICFVCFATFSVHRRAVRSTEKILEVCRNRSDFVSVHCGYGTPADEADSGDCPMCTRSLSLDAGRRRSVFDRIILTTTIGAILPGLGYEPEKLTRAFSDRGGVLSPKQLSVRRQRLPRSAERRYGAQVDRSLGAHQPGKDFRGYRSA